MGSYLDLFMFAALMAAILMGFPVAFSIGGVAIVFAYLGWALGVMDISLLGATSQRIFGLLSNNVLVAIPLFVLMGAVLEKSRIAEELLDTMGRLFGQLRGGLGISVVLVGALLAASTGIVGATVVAMGMIALPTMLRAGYDPKIAYVMSNSYQQAQYEQGKFAVEALSVGQFFAAAMLPGLLLVVLYLLYILILGLVRPKSMPPAPAELARPSTRKIASTIVPPVLLIFAVLGAILGGVATPTEAASVGAIGAVLVAAVRIKSQPRLILIGVAALVLVGVFAGLIPVRLQRDDLSVGSWILGGTYIVLILFGVVAIILSVKELIVKRVMVEAATSTMTMTAMIFATILAAGIFSLVFVGLGGEERIAHILTNMPGGTTGALVFCLVFVFVLGFFLDFVEISVILLPLIVPPLIMMGHDPVWLGVLLAINLQTSFLTPPFGFSLFYLRGAAPPEVSTGQIYAGVMPFIALQALGMLFIYLAPQVSTWLPRLLF